MKVLKQELIGAWLKSHVPAKVYYWSVVYNDNEYPGQNKA
jgi:hypothetical protein